MTGDPARRILVTVGGRSHRGRPRLRWDDGVLFFIRREELENWGKKQGNLAKVSEEDYRLKEDSCATVNDGMLQNII